MIMIHTTCIYSIPIIANNLFNTYDYIYFLFPMLAKCSFNLLKKKEQQMESNISRDEWYGIERGFKKEATS
jgi:hypothetical protein